MNRAQASLKKTLPTAPPIPEEIEEPTPAKTAPGATIADSIAAFLGRYLACEPHQRTVLALWVVYSWCFEHFPTAAYLDVRSPEPQSGKSLCLRLLELLCDSPWLAAGADVRTITSRLLTSDTRIKAGEDFVTRPPYTILLDDCQHAFHGSEHQPLVAILNSGAHAMGRYARYRCEYSVFGPKAFAGNAPLPASLASRCIPIVLHRKRPSDTLSRFDRGLPSEDVERFHQALARWAKANATALAQAAEEAPAGIPPGLSPREQECAEPLLHIAGLIGGHWPEKARTALAAVFNLAESSRSVQMLCDVRVAFDSRHNPEYLSTRDILAVVGAFEYRPWSAWPRNSGRRLGALLHPFGIVSRNLRIDSETVLRGYLLRDFQDAWERYLPPAIYGQCSATDFSSATPSTTEFARLA
ncbi:MAG TPA: DUF3631 domain-containing protein [Candidatus Saccharimonadales bacterium]|jgi:hypothetical protein|nr:DUF3631 domain-containing protein [Candidatus Saccharimonadales bacterium]